MILSSDKGEIEAQPGEVSYLGSPGSPVTQTGRDLLIPSAVHYLL